MGEECIHALPINAGYSCKRIEEFQLRSSSGRNDARMSTLCNCLSNRASRLLRRRTAQRCFVVKDSQKHEQSSLSLIEPQKPQYTERRERCPEKMNRGFIL